MLSGGGGSNNKSGSSPTPAVELPLLSTIQSLPKEIRNLLAGGIAGMIAKSFVAPIDRIKILYQVTSAQFRLRDVPKVAYSIIETEGTAALWKGNTATMIRVFPYSGIQFMMFDYCKVYFLSSSSSQRRRRQLSEGECCYNNDERFNERSDNDGNSSLHQQSKKKNGDSGAHNIDYSDIAGKRHHYSENNGTNTARTKTTATPPTTTTTHISHRGTIALQPSDELQQQQQQQEGTMNKTRKGGLTPIESLISGMIGKYPTFFVVTCSSQCTHKLTLIASLTAGTVSVLCTYPLDLARAQLAVLRKEKKPNKSIVAGGVGVTAGTSSSSSHLDKQLGIGGSTKRSSKGIGYVLSHTIQQNGARGLYRGITPTILGILPYSGVAFTINEQAKRQITHIMHRDPTTIERLQCGALSGLFAQTLAYPLEVTRRRMQTIGIVPTSGKESATVNFMGVSQVKPCVDELPVGETNTTQTTGETATKAKKRQPQQQQSQLHQKTPQQRIPSNINATTTVTATQQHHKPPSMITTMRHLLEEQGIRGFYKGVSMNWVKGPIAFSISFTTFDTIQGWIETPYEKEMKKNGNRGSQGEGGHYYSKNDKAVKMSISRRLTNNDD